MIALRQPRTCNHAFDYTQTLILAHSCIHADGWALTTDVASGKYSVHHDKKTLIYNHLN